MNAERVSPVAARARVHAALGDPARLAIVDRLVLGDASPSELGRALELPSNLLAHHVTQLERVGLLERSRSEGDHRRTYLRLRPRLLAGLVPTALVRTPRVVFVCTRNSARSQLAAALWKRRSAVPAASAGTAPAERVHPLAVGVAREHGLSLNRARTAWVGDVLRPEDLVVVVCDNAHEHLGKLGDQGRKRVHWSVRDPTRSGSRVAFARAFTELTDRVDRLAPAVRLAGEGDD
jgi:ArsR family transcriptional regulator, arsenate/arsenite/antimonite-responsive transcriptional repressor / arsenate reductase (thioredoxin)